MPEPGTTVTPFAADPRLSFFVQQFGASSATSDILRLLLSDQRRSFTIGELMSCTGASNRESARALDLLSDAGLASIFELNRQARVFISPLPLMQHLARQVAHVMASGARKVNTQDTSQEGTRS